ncbi:hypothetical protein D3C79_783280 [compost metagenome]
MRRRHGQVGGHAAPCFIEQRWWRPYPVVQAADDVGALRRHQPRDFREPDVPADQQADTADRCLEHWETQVARGEPELFLVPQVGFAVMPEQAFRTEQYGTVVEFQPLAFGKTRSQVDLVLPGEIRPGFQAATLLQRFGMGIGLCPCVEGVAGIGQLG